MLHKRMDSCCIYSNKLVILLSVLKLQLKVRIRQMLVAMVKFNITELRAPTRGRGGGGQCPGAALLLKRRSSKWSLTNEPGVRFRFRF